MVKTKVTNQTVKRVPLSEMVAQSGYQRPTNYRQVDRITNGFSEPQLGILTVSYRDGVYNIIDGNHRSHALRNLGYTHAVAVVHTGLTYEQESALYSKQNENKRMMKPFDIFKSGLEANDGFYASINQIVRANGFSIGLGGNKGFQKITAILTLETIVLEYGFNTLDETLCLIASTWPGFTKATNSASLLGVAEFVHRYGMASFADRLKEKCMSVWYGYEDEMRNRCPSTNISPRKRFCRLLVEHYNAGLGRKSGERLVWEG